MVTTPEIAWTAGFLEAEGWFGYIGKAPFTTASQVQKEPLERLQQSYGGKLRWYPNKWSGAWHWSLCGVGLMMTVLPLMSPKRTQQIEKTIAIWKTKRCLPKHRNVCIRGHLYDERNTYYDNGSRSCRVCKARAAREFRARQRILNALI